MREARARRQEPYGRSKPRPAARYQQAAASAAWDRGATYEPAADVQSSVVEQEAVLLKLGTGRSYTLNPVGTLVWELLSAGQPLGTVLAALEERFDAPAPQLRSDLGELVRQLQAEGLLEQRG